MSMSFDPRIATCSTEKWLENSLGQSPCQVATMVGGKGCGIDDFIILPLSGSASYGGPTTMKGCQCNTIIYNLISACALCQSGTIIDWLQYSAVCVETVGVYAGQLPGGIPSGIAIPAWAYLYPQHTNHQFDLAAAKQVIAPDSTSPTASSTTMTTSTSTSRPAFVTSTPPGTSTSKGHTRSIPTDGLTATGGPQTENLSATSANMDSTNTTPTLGHAPGISGITSDVHSTGALYTNADGKPVSDPAPGSPDDTSTPRTTSTNNGPSNGRPSSSTIGTGTVIGAAVGGAVALLLIFSLIVCLLQRRKKLRAPHSWGIAGSPSSSCLQPFVVSRQPSTHWHAGGRAPSEANMESEFPPAYATEDGGAPSAVNSDLGAPARVLPHNGRFKYRDYSLPQAEPSPARKPALRP